MDVVAQWVRVSRASASRGGAEATRRNAVPAAFTLPEAGSPLSHEVEADEWTRFVPRWRVRQWVRWQINYRFPPPCCGEPTYRQDTLNLAYGRVSSNVFHGEPARRVDELVRLR